MHVIFTAVLHVPLIVLIVTHIGAWLFGRGSEANAVAKAAKRTAGKR